MSAHPDCDWCTETAERNDMRARLRAVTKLADDTPTYGGSDVEGWVNLSSLRSALGLPHRTGYVARSGGRPVSPETTP